MKSIYIYGASGHGLVVADIAQVCGYKEVVFIDDGKNQYQTFEDIKENNHIPIALGLGDNKIRAKLFEKVVLNGFSIATLLHPSSIISSSASIGTGSVVMPNVVVNARASVGNGVILNTSSIVEHECKVDNFVHISPNVALAGNVKVGEFTHLGIGSSVIQSIIIGRNCMIGGGSMVVSDISDNLKVVGIPAKELSKG